MKCNRLHFDYCTTTGRGSASTGPFRLGDVLISIALQSDSPKGPARVTLSLDGKAIATGEVAVLQRCVLFGLGKCDIGADRRSPVGDNYDPPSSSKARSMRLISK